METQDVGDARVMGYLLRKAANREWNQTKRNKLKGVVYLKNVLTPGMEMENLEFT